MTWRCNILHYVMTCIYKNKLTVTTYLQLALIKGFHFVRRSVAYVGGGILRTTHGEVDFHLKLNPGRQLKSNTFFGQIVIKTLSSNLIQILSFLVLVQVRRLFRYEAIKASWINPSTTGWTHPFVVSVHKLAQSLLVPPQPRIRQSQGLLASVSSLRRWH